MWLQNLVLVEGGSRAGKEKAAADDAEIDDDCLAGSIDTINQWASSQINLTIQLAS